jgi:hypothetical protein
LLSLIAAAALTWWVDVYIDARQIDNTSDWRERLDQLLTDAGGLYRDQVVPLDTACDVQIRPWSITVYRPGEGGYTDGGTATGGSGRPDVAVRSDLGPRTRLYLGPGPGWAIGSGNGMGWAWAWLGYWCPTWDPGCANGTASSGVLLDPWGRISRTWCVAHELGHAAGLFHREVFKPEECSLMAYESMLHTDCPSNGSRLTVPDCAAIQARARVWQTPPPAEIPVIWQAKPRPPQISR